MTKGAFCGIARREGTGKKSTFVNQYLDDFKTAIFDFSVCLLVPTIMINKG